MILPFILSVLAGIVSVIALRYGLTFVFYLLRRLYGTIPTRYRPAAKPEDERIQVLVLGDIGRSPRMQYHAMSIAKHGRKVDLVGYKETARHPELIGNPNVSLFALTPQPEWITWGTLPFFLIIPSKVIQQFWTLFYTLMYTTPPARWIIIQNPPSIPTFHVALIVSIIRGSKVVVDWHNYGHSLLTQKAWWLRWLAPIYRMYEVRLGRWLANANLAVTDAMSEELKGPKFNIKTPVYTLHDRPAEIFQPIQSAKARKEVLERIPETRRQAQSILDGSMRLIVSSTSWTEDEDFSILLDALVAYANPAADDDSEPPSPILAIITGKGPGKEYYTAKIKELEDASRLPGIQILTAWLSNRDYASLLASADLGVSLHKSSSGVDLPMKVVDMFGAGLPVAAYSAFKSFSELVKEGQNGCGFETAADLTEVLKRLLSHGGAKELKMLKEGALKEGAMRWDEEWDRVVAGVVEVKV